MTSAYDQYKKKFWSLKTFTRTTGEVAVSPCYFNETPRGSLPLYQIWHPVCPATDPEAAIERAKELAASTGDPFKVDPGTMVPYPS